MVLVYTRTLSGGCFHACELDWGGLTVGPPRQPLDILINKLLEDHSRRGYESWLLSGKFSFPPQRKYMIRTCKTGISGSEKKPESTIQGSTHVRNTLGGTEDRL